MKNFIEKIILFLAIVFVYFILFDCCTLYTLNTNIPISIDIAKSPTQLFSLQGLQSK